MYGTIARFHLKPGMDARLRDLEQEFQASPAPGEVVTYIYQMDADPSEYYMAVVFESKEAYHTNAQRPEQDVQYRRFRELLTADPEWHDGEIVVTIRPEEG